MKTIAIANLKGGTGKTTSAAYLAHAFHQLGQRALLVDADPQAQLLSWSQTAGADFPMPAVWLATPNIHRQLPGIDTRPFDVAIIDTPPIYDHSRTKVEKTQEQRRAHGIVVSAMRAADVVLVPLSASMMELQGIPRVLEAINQASEARGDGKPLVRFSLNRSVWNLSMNGIARKHLKSIGCELLTTEIPFRPATIGQAFGGPITGKLHGYLSIAMDLEKIL
jgi:chromosome partitioning protein